MLSAIIIIWRGTSRNIAENWRERESKEREHKEKGTKKQNGDGKDIDQVVTTTSKNLFVVYDEDVINIACHETSWVIDSGASIYVETRDFISS